MKTKNVAVIILAAGLGTRMKSDKAKVLHELLGKSMILYVVDTAVKVAGINVIAIIGHQAEKVKKIVSKKHNIKYVIQEQQLGTGHAVQCGVPSLSDDIEKVVILCGDVPLLSPETVYELVDKHEIEKNDITVLSVKLDKPTGYGRMVSDKDGNVLKIVEESDSNSQEKEIKNINSGIYCVDKNYLKKALEKIDSNNAQKEFYLTDIIEIGNKDNKKIGMFVGENADEVIGINSCDDLAAAEKIMMKQIRKNS